MLQNYGRKDSENIYEYKVHLYIYNLHAIDEELSKDHGLASPEEKLKKACQGTDNLTIEPLSSIELANFYSVEFENNGLMFHKNLCDSFILNEQQGSIYFLMQEKKKDLYLNNESNSIKFVLKKLEYDQMSLSKPEDVFKDNRNGSLKSDLD